MKTQGIMRRARRQILVLVSTTLIVPVVFAQAPPANTKQDSDAELDVTMRVIVDPDAKVPDEIVHRIPFPKPKPATAVTPPKSDKDKGNSAQSQAQGQGREFGQQTAEQARQRADEARRNKEKPPKTPGPPGQPPGPPPAPPRGSS
jgi:hypothetical protein